MTEGYVVRRRWEAVRMVRSVQDAFLVWRWISLVTWVDRFAVRFDGDGVRLPA